MRFAACRPRPWGGRQALTTSYTHITFARPARADLALGVGCVSRARKRLGKHGIQRGVTQHDARSGNTK